MIDVSLIVNDPALAQSFTIQRSSGGSWLRGVWTPTTTTIQGFGVISIASARELEMVPEGDRGQGAMVFWAQQPLYVTRVNNAGQMQSSDIFLWQNEQFRVLHVKQFRDYGYYRAIGVRMAAV